jgi:myo-inositol-1(or 4)-monophosphatase
LSVRHYSHAWEAGIDDIHLAKHAARLAGACLKEYFGRPAEKLAAKSSARDLVSKADREADAVVVDALLDARPDDGICSEERPALQTRSGRVWVIDPLDGTTNFLHSYPVWCVSVALREAGREVVGVVYDPLREEMFAAERDRGCWLNDEPLQLSVDAARELPSAILAVNTGDYGPPGEYGPAVARGEAASGTQWDARLSGCLALDLAWVAAGRVGAYCGRAGSGDWDWAAGKLLVECAGGAVAMVDAEPPALIAGRPRDVDSIKRAVLRLIEGAT